MPLLDRIVRNLNVMDNTCRLTLVELPLAQDFLHLGQTAPLLSLILEDGRKKFLLRSQSLQELHGLEDRPGLRRYPSPAELA